MQYCRQERRDFPAHQFTVEDGVLMHHPPGGGSHRAGSSPVEEPNQPAAPYDVAAGDQPDGEAA